MKTFIKNHYIALVKSYYEYVFLNNFSRYFLYKNLNTLTYSKYALFLFPNS